MKKTLFAALVALISTITTLAAGTDPVNITITLKNGETVTYAAAQMDSVRFVGGQFGETGAIGMKIYLKNSSQSVDYLYSQIETMTCTEPVNYVETPVISPVGGEITEPTSVTITCATSGTTIYYTTDGTVPSATNGTVYTVPIILSSSTTIKAIAVKGSNSSTVATAIFVYAGSAGDNNANANWHETLYISATDHDNFTTSRATYGMAWRLEYPHINNNSTNNAVVVHATSDYGISLSMEIDKSQRANRWSCYTMHKGVPNNNVGRYDNWRKDPCLPSSAQVDTKEYTNGNYTTNTINLDGSNTTLFSRGHVCASEDRQSLKEQLPRHALCVQRCNDC